jgi:CHAD domain-containing protein
VRPLKAVQNKLEQELNKRTHSLQLQNEALEKYIQYNTTKLEEPIKNLKSSIGELQDASIYSDLLKASQEELDLVLNQINEGLRLKGQINRNEIMKNG